MAKKMTYKTAGVDIDKAEASLARVKSRIVDTHDHRVLRDVGLFGGFYDISRMGLRSPVLVASTDGVGTKLKVAMLANRHDTVGQDLVNHCINDIAVCGARPLFFLDYFASGNLEPHVYEEVLNGLTHACKIAGVPLIGGETAEMPDLYQPHEYDMCGTVVGIVDRTRIIDGSGIAAGDLLVGVTSNGLHTNGFTLARRVLLDTYDIEDTIPELGRTLAEELLRVHINYASLIAAATEHLPVKGIAHITGGGIVGNTRRLLPEGCAVAVDWSAWEVPAIFRLIQETGEVPEEDMRRTFNMGVGLVFVMDPSRVDELLEIGREFPFSLFPMGRIA